MPVCVLELAEEYMRHGCIPTIIPALDDPRGEGECVWLAAYRPVVSLVLHCDPDTRARYAIMLTAHAREVAAESGMVLT